MKRLEDIELFGDEMRADPYPFYDQLRREHPVYWDEKTQSWYLSRYHDVVTGLTDLRFSADRASYMEHLAHSEDLKPLFALLANRMVLTDPPQHTRLRNLLSHAFRPHIINGMASHIQQIVDGLLDKVLATGKMDVVGDFAFPLPATVIAEMIGIPPEDRDQLRKWTDEFIIFFARPPASLSVEDYRHSAKGAENITNYFRQFVEKLRHHPQDNLLSILEQAEEAGDQLSEIELFANANLLLAAGHETTTGLITNGTMALLQHPDQLEKLKQDLSLMPHAVEELLRFDAPVHFTHRIALEDIDIGGKTIKKGQLVHLLLASANRDPEQFADADQLDITRNPNHHVSFGQGAHFCLGAALARLEANTAFRTMLTKMPNLTLADQTLKYRELANLRRVNALQVVF